MKESINNLKIDREWFIYLPILWDNFKNRQVSGTNGNTPQMKPAKVGDEISGEYENFKKIFFT